MKKSIFSRHLMPVFLFILIVTTNCGQKDILKQDDAASEGVLPSKALTRVDDYNSLTFGQIRLFAVDVQKYCFNQMNSGNKARLWKERISYVSSLYKNSIKKAEILELQAFISPELFSTKQLGDFEITINKWVSDNKALFGLENLRLILTTLSELSISDTENDDLSWANYDSFLCPPRCRVAPDPQLCTCSRQSVLGNQSAAVGCTVTPGCGTFWIYNCDGICDPVIGN